MRSPRSPTRPRAPDVVPAAERCSGLDRLDDGAEPRRRSPATQPGRSTTIPGARGRRRVQSRERSRTWMRRLHGRASQLRAPLPALRRRRGRGPPRDQPGARTSAPGPSRRPAVRSHRTQDRPRDLRPSAAAAGRQRGCRAVERRGRLERPAVGRRSTRKAKASSRPLAVAHESRPSAETPVRVPVLARTIPRAGPCRACEEAVGESAREAGDRAARSATGASCLAAGRRPRGEHRASSLAGARSERDSPLASNSRPRWPARRAPATAPAVAAARALEGRRLPRRPRGQVAERLGESLSLVVSIRSTRSPPGGTRTRATSGAAARVPTRLHRGRDPADREPEARSSAADAVRGASATGADPCAASTTQRGDRGDHAARRRRWPASAGDAGAARTATRRTAAATLRDARTVARAIAVPAWPGLAATDRRPPGSARSVGRVPAADEHDLGDARGSAPPAEWCGRPSWSAGAPRRAASRAAEAVRSLASTRGVRGAAAVRSNSRSPVARSTIGTLTVRRAPRGQRSGSSTAASAGRRPAPLAPRRARATVRRGSGAQGGPRRLAGSCHRVPRSRRRPPGSPGRAGHGERRAGRRRT